jgi:hypothetical protein
LRSRGARADCTELKAAICTAIQSADPGGRNQDTLDRYKSDAHLDDIIAAIRTFEGGRPGAGWTQLPPDLDEPPPFEPDDDQKPSPPVVRPIVQVINGELPNVVDAAEAFLVECDRNLYEFGDQVVRPDRAPIKIADNRTTIGLRLVLVRLHHVIERFARCIEFRKFNRKEWQWLLVDCPAPVAKNLP